MTLELFKQETGLFILHVPYRGIASAFNDLLGSQTQIITAVVVPITKDGE